MINEYDRPVKGYKTSEQYEHPETVLYDNFAPAENMFVEEAVEVTEPSEEIKEESSEEIIEEVKEGEE
jgi:hypothetical protein